MSDFIEVVYAKLITLVMQTRDSRYIFTSTIKTLGLASFAIFFARYAKDVYKLTRSYQATSGKWEERIFAYASQPVADIIKLITTEVIGGGGGGAITALLIIAAHMLMISSWLVMPLTTIVYKPEITPTITIFCAIHVHLLLFGSLIMVLGFYRMRSKLIYRVKEEISITNISIYPIFMACSLSMPIAATLCRNETDITVAIASMDWVTFLLLSPSIVLYIMSSSLSSSVFSSTDANSTSLAHDSSSVALLHGFTHHGHILVHRIFFVSIFANGQNPIPIVHKVLNKGPGSIWLILKLIVIYAAEEARKSIGYKYAMPAKELIAYAIGPITAIWCALIRLWCQQ